MSIIIRILRRLRRRKTSPLCKEVKQRFMECLRNCMEPPFSYILCHEACVKNVAEDYGLSIKKVEKCLNE